MYIENDMVAQKQSMLTQTPSIHHLETQRHKVVIVYYLTKEPLFNQRRRKKKKKNHLLGFVAEVKMLSSKNKNTLKQQHL